MSTPQFRTSQLGSALKKAILAGILTAAALPAVSSAAEGTFLVQLNDYEGHHAYYAVYLVDPEGRYVKTLYVSGPEKRWWKDIPRWWKYLGRAQDEKLDAITGASTPAGDRKVIHLDLDDDILDAGYKVRIDSTVEDQNNYPTDVEVELTSDKQKEKIPGTGYVRYFRYKWDK